ncbi:MAG: hypothetical protein WCZ99_03220 [Candidatus Paceibacterota bacterium]
MNIEKIFIFIIILVGLGALLLFVFLSGSGIKQLELIYPVSGEEMFIGETYEIVWKARNIEKVGIVLFMGEEPKWIAKELDGREGKYNWKIQPGQKYGDNYWIAVFEYPYREENLIDYSKGPFSIVFADIDSCDSLSVSEDRPYVPISYPGIRRVFVTNGSYDGDLKGFSGADEICQKEAEDLGFEGSWTAFIGGDRDIDTAVERLSRTPKGTSGVFVEATPEGELGRGDTCHRLLSNDFNGFLSFFDIESDVKEKVSEDFFTKFSNIWTGRIRTADRVNCIEITFPRGRTAQDNYSFTVSCQGWTTVSRLLAENLQVRATVIDDIPSSDNTIMPSLDIPTCYTSQGLPIDARGIGGLSTEEEEDFLKITGKGCAEKKRILCIEN